MIVDEAHVLVLGEYTTVIERLWAADATTSLMCDASVLHRQSGLAEHRTLTVTRDATPDQLLDLATAVHHQHPLTHAVAMDDSVMTAAALIRDTLHLEGGNPGEVVEAVQDKDAYRAHLRHAGLSTLAHTTVEHPDDILAFGHTHGWPVVVKPLKGCGSTGVTINVTPQTATHALTHATTRTTDSPTGHALVEQQATGRLITVDTFTHHGRHRIVMIGFELVAHPRPVVMCTGMPAPLHPTERDAITDLITAALDDLGVTTGPTHSEILLDDDHHPVLIETQLRLGGELPELTQATLDLDPYDLWARQILGHDPLPTIDHALTTAGDTPLCTVVVYPAIDGPGHLEEVTGIEEARRSAGVLHVTVNGEARRDLRAVADIHDRVVALFARAESPAKALRLALRAVDKIRVRMRTAEG